MNTSELIKMVCKESGISVSELARRIGQSPQNLNKKLQRNTISTDEMILIANVLNIRYEQSYTLDNGEKISITN